MRRNQTLCFGEVHRFLDSLFDGELHAKRILSLTNATLGVIKTASLAVNTRVEPEGIFPGFVGIFMRLLALAILVFVGVLLCDI
jgi:hypothetical protein